MLGSELTIRPLAGAKEIVPNAPRSYSSPSPARAIVLRARVRKDYDERTNLRLHELGASRLIW